MQFHSQVPQARAASAAAFSVQLSPTGETVWIKRAGDYCGQDSAAWFVVMGAIAELAGRGKFGDFGKQHVQTLSDILHVQASDAGSVDHPTTARHCMQRPRRGRVAAL